MERFLTIDHVKEEVKKTIGDGSLTYQQQTSRLAKIAENVLDYPIGPDHLFYQLYDQGQVCDLDEGHGPYAPRYVLPDFEKYLREGSKFLRMAPPRNLLEAITALLVIYNHIPSVTRYPVYLGSLDKLLEPFVEKEDPQLAQALLRSFIIQLDRTINDSFCHGNLGPEETKTGRMILEIVSQEQTVTPNLTFLYEEGVSPDSYAQEALAASLKCANPAFANHKMYREDFGPNPYGIASCYNALPIGGGAFTLSRIRLNKIAQASTSLEDFMENKLPQAVETLEDFMEKKIDFLVEESSFFKSNFMLEEGLIDPDKFVGLFGIVGLHECVQTLLDLEGSQALFGTDPEANQMGLRVMDRVKELVGGHRSKYGPIWDHKFMLHAQVGAAGDQGTTAAHRIKIGKEPDLYTHLRQTALFQPYFPGGCGDHFPFDFTAQKNPGALLDIFKGGFRLNNRYLSSYNHDGDLIRVTGYLVKKSDVEAFSKGRQVTYDTVQYAQDPLSKYGILNRKVEEVK